MFRGFNLKIRRYSTDGFLFKRSLNEPSSETYSNNVANISPNNDTFESWRWRLNRQKQLEDCTNSLSQIYFSLENSNLPSQCTQEYLSGIERSVQELLKNPIKMLSQSDLNHEIDNQIFDNELFDTEIKISRQKRDSIEQETKNQQNSPLWRHLRSNKLTASIAGKLYKSIKKQSKSKLFRKITENEAMRHGIVFESLAIEALEKSRDVKIKESGLWLSMDKPYLGASPDGLIFKNDILYSVVEVKCPFTARMQTIDYWMENYKTCLDNNRTLSRKHDYYYQVQMQMALAEVDFCLFGIYTGVDIFYEWIEFDQELWKKMEIKFEQVWKDLNECD